MRQALDVLIEINKLSIGEDAVVALPGEIDGAMDNLRAAIEQYDQTALELCNECGWRAMIPGEGCLTCARQKAKPVAWFHEEKYKTHFTTDPSEDMIGKYWQPLYTAPRQWVGLTDKEIEDEWERVTGHSILGGNRSDGRTMFLSPDEVVHYTQSIEAKLKEKNHAG